MVWAKTINYESCYQNVHVSMTGVLLFKLDQVKCILVVFTDLLTCHCQCRSFNGSEAMTMDYGRRHNSLLMDRWIECATITQGFLVAAVIANFKLFCSTYLLTYLYLLTRLFSNSLHISSTLNSDCFLNGSCWWVCRCNPETMAMHRGR